MQQDIKNAIVALVTGDEAVNAIIDGRVYGVHIPNRPVRPYLRFQQISTSRDYHQTGKSALRVDRYQFDAWADDRADADNLAKEVARLLHEQQDVTVENVKIYRVFLEDESDEYDPDWELEGKQQDYFFHYKEN